MSTSRSLCTAIILALSLFSGLSLAASGRNEECQPSTQTVGVQGGTIHYRKAGEGSPVVLLHGLFAQKEQWDAVLCLLAAAGHTAIAPDLPGYGQSIGFPLADYKLENQVVLLNQWVNALGISRFDLAGNSMGGAIAALYVQAYPRQIRSLAFIGAPMGITGWGNGVREAIFEGINPFIPTDLSQLGREMNLLFTKPPILPESIQAGLIKEYTERNRHYQQIWDIVNLYGSVLDKHPRSKVPTLIVWGQNDRIFEVKGADRLRQRFLQAKLIRLPDAGHLPQLEKPEETTGIYLRFLGNRPIQAGSVDSRK